MNTAPSARPLVLAGSRVEAVLAGRKTQARRVVTARGAPYGRPGDLLYVREAWRVANWCHEDGAVVVEYLADGARSAWLRFDVAEDPFGERFERLWIESSDDLIAAGFTWPNDEGVAVWPGPGPRPKRPTRRRAAITLPKRFARLWLRVTDVRVERLQALGEDDARAEGVERPILSEGPIIGDLAGVTLRGHPLTGEYRDAFRDAWNARHDDPAHGWNANPRVWVVTFERTEVPS